MRNRNKFDWTKAFKFVDSKQAFDDIDTNDDSLIITIPTDDNKPPVIQNKEEIPVPKIDTVSRITMVKKFAKITPNYIRLPAYLNLPIATRYQLTEIDHTFIKNHKTRFLSKGQSILTEEFLRKAIQDLQIKAGKQTNIPRNKGWMTSFLQKQYRQFLQLEYIEIFAETVYNYQKNRRDELHFPLLRSLWKPNSDQYNHMLAFRPRQREKRSLRRTNRGVEEDIIEELYDEFELALKISDRISMREDLKLKQVQLNISSFYNQCKNICQQPSEIDDLKIEERPKDKERMKGLHSDIENYKQKRQNLESFTFVENASFEIDQKQTIANFLATVVSEAEQLGISYQKIYYPNNSLVIEKSKHQKPAQNVAIVEPPQVDRVQEQQKSTQQFTSMSLSRLNNHIFKHFQEQDGSYIKPPADYLDLRRRRVDSYYFGSDDEGEYKDLRKNITTSFKRFTQLQQMTRAVSATSQN